jgi:hypothetical protein
VVSPTFLILKIFYVMCVDMFKYIGASFYQVNEKLVVEKARTWLNTPFHPQGRIKGIGCDCLGLILGVADEVDAVSCKYGRSLCNYDIETYSFLRDGKLLDNAMKTHLFEIQRTHWMTEILIGYVLLLSFGKSHRHLAIVSEVMKDGQFRIIHSCLGVRRVIEHVINQCWLSNIVGCFRLVSVSS